MGEHDFNILTAELQDSRLIEASAGTGKTFSVAVLVLRLILEKEIEIEKMLMVTFTNAAVAEMESRIRKFIRIGYKYSDGKIDLDEDDKIRLVIEGCNKTEERKKELLRKAVRSLDNLSVMTIHSFCQKTINEFTFETNQSFDFEIVTDDSDLLISESNRYLREVLNTLNLETFRELNKEVKFEKMHELLKKHLLGMKFIDSYIEDDSEIEALREEIAGKNNELDTFIRGSYPQVLATQMRDNDLKQEAAQGNTEEFKRRFRDQINSKKPAAYFASFEFMKADFMRFEEEIKHAEDKFINYIYLDFFRYSDLVIKRVKRKKGYISYDDQIKTVYSSLGNETLKDKLGKKYSAVFIDEFQDTDNYQYEIFKTVFSENFKDKKFRPVIFYIGDPKQSIYGWRGADLDTYKTAKGDVGADGILRMNTNYRSTAKMIDALNILLSAGGNNMFIDEKIEYHDVEQGAANLGTMTFHGKEVEPVTLWEFDNNDERTNFRAVAREIFILLTNDYRIKEDRIKPKDIGVLVRENRQGDDIKKLLADFNIPAVKRDDKKVLGSDEARMIQYLLKAVISPNRGDINRALLSRYFGYKADTIKTIDDEKHIEVFIGLKKTLKEEGIYNMISSFLNTYGVRAICMKDVLGQRVLTNISQVAEILHKKEKQQKYTADELLVWMQRSIDDADEEYQQRIESDEEAVQISTIHKAKGLEYKIVFAPCLCMIPRFKRLEKNNVNDFKKAGEYYFTFNYPELSSEDKDLFDKQKEQENRRLIYVALTRPVYKCYISFMPRSYLSQEVVSSFEDIYKALNKNNQELFRKEDFSEGEFVNINGRYTPEEDEQRQFSPKPAPSIEIRNTFGIHSYSALSRAHYSAPFEKAELGEAENYDQFIFQDLGRGANAGTALHTIFERLDFAGDEESWRQTLSEASQYWKNILKEEKLELFMQLVYNAMNVKIPFIEKEFTLKKVEHVKKLPELEFYFSLDRINRTEINTLMGDEADLSGEAEIEGLMTGFIDLLFEHNGKYYILDWKSNHLGNSPDDYDTDGMAEAMKGSNYNLQYMIYTVAAVRWLKSRIMNFDYENQFGGVIYVFLRGVREGMDTGIYTIKPDKTTIKGLDEALSGKLQEA